MSVLRQAVRSRQRVPSCARINWSDSITRGLCFALVPGRGVLPREVTTGYAATMCNALPSIARGGLEFRASPGQGLRFAGMPDAPLLGPITVAWRGVLDTGSNYHELFNKSVSSGTTDAPVEFRTTNAATPALAIIRANGSAYSDFYGPSVSLGVEHLCAVTQGAAMEVAATFWLDGIPTTGSGRTGSGTGAPTGSGADVYVGRRDDAFVNLNGLMRHIYAWSRVLSGPEIARLYTDPYCVLL